MMNRQTVPSIKLEKPHVNFPKRVAIFAMIAAGYGFTVFGWGLALILAINIAPPIYEMAVAQKINLDSLPPRQDLLTLGMLTIMLIKAGPSMREEARNWRLSAR